MRIRLQTVVAAVTTAALGLILNTAHGAVISVNFQGADTTGLAPTDSTGVISAANYNNITGSSGSSIALNDSGGTASGISLSFSDNSVPPQTAGIFGDNSTPQYKLFGGDVIANYGTVSATLTGLTAFSSYDLYVYYYGGTSFPGSRTATISTSGSPTTYYVSNTGSPFTSFTQSTSTSNSTYSQGNYVKFAGLTNSTQTFSYNFVSNQTGVVGFQVVGTAAPEPASLGLLGLGGMTLLARRRKTA